MPMKAKKNERPWKIKRQDNGSKMENRSRSRREYHTARWTRESKAFRDEHPLCERCKKKGLIVSSEVVDHIVPVDVCSDFWDRSNWQALCRNCNIEKGNKDKRLINGKRTV